MFCKNCGSNVPEGQNVCPSCGTVLTPPPAAPAASPASSAPSFQLPGGLDAQKILTFVKPAGKTPNFISLGGAAVAFISMFLPFVKVTVFGVSKSLSLWGASAWILTFLFAAIGGYFAFIGNHKVTIGAGALGLIEAIRQSSSVSKTELGAYSSLVDVSKGIGCWLLFIACIAVVGGAVFAMLQEKKQPQNPTV